MCAFKMIFLTNTLYSNDGKQLMPKGKLDSSYFIVTSLPGTVARALPQNFSLYFHAVITLVCVACGYGTQQSDQLRYSFSCYLT